MLTGWLSTCSTCSQVAVAVDAPADVVAEEKPHPREGDFSSKMSFYESIMQARVPRPSSNLAPRLLHAPGLC